MIDIMVDVETGGIRPDRSPMIQLAAVKFDVANFTVDHDFFNAALEIPPWRSWEEGTRQWWAQQKQDILRDIYSRMEPPAEVMRRFADWVGYGTQARFWAKPVHFDWPFVAGYLADFDVPNPFDFRRSIDCRSYANGISFPNEPISEKSIEFSGDAHNALYDALHQIRWMFEVQKNAATTV